VRHARPAGDDEANTGARAAREEAGFGPCAILNTAEVRLLDREVRGVIASYPGLEAHLDRSEDSIRWHALGAVRRGPRCTGIREVSVALRIAQYRLWAIERGHLSEVRPDLARRAGLLDDAPQPRRAPTAREGRDGT
jgi:hypothetical protein